MAYYTLPSPGKVVNGEEIGPCVGACEHKDCAQTRAQAAQSCLVCGEAIGYETPFYYEYCGTLRHARCAHREERERKERG